MALTRGSRSPEGEGGERGGALARASGPACGPRKGRRGRRGCAGPRAALGRRKKERKRGCWPMREKGEERELGWAKTLSWAAFFCSLSFSSFVFLTH
jgi:hypothetical protein